MENSRRVALVPLTEPFGLSNDVLFSTRESPFFKTLIDALPRKSKWYGSPYLTVMYSTGPMFLSLQYMRMSPEEQNGVLVLPPELYNAKKTSYFRHLRGSTWHSSDAHAVQWLTSNRYAIAVALLLTVLYTRSIRMQRKKKTR